MPTAITDTPALPPVALLPPESRTLLWTARHMVACWPGCSSIRPVLMESLGERAAGAEHLVRCLLVGIGNRVHRRLAFGNPAATALFPDEALMLEAVGLDGAEAAPDALMLLTGCPKARALAPLLLELRRTFAGAAESRALALMPVDDP
ncbi:MAG: hypothetical protein V2J26_10485 [Pacificimonas sp.]|jgi:hypothetical protein|nr:hypothetical protein [Pacificimonas sp.]